MKVRGVLSKLGILYGIGNDKDCVLSFHYPNGGSGTGTLDWYKDHGRVKDKILDLDISEYRCENEVLYNGRIIQHFIHFYLTNNNVSLP